MINSQYQCWTYIISQVTIATVLKRLNWDSYVALQISNTQGTYVHTLLQWDLYNFHKLWLIISLSRLLGVPVWVPPLSLFFSDVCDVFLQARLAWTQLWPSRRGWQLRCRNITATETIEVSSETKQLGIQYPLSIRCQQCFHVRFTRTHLSWGDNESCKQLDTYDVCSII